MLSKIKQRQTAKTNGKAMTKANTQKAMLSKEGIETLTMEGLPLALQLEEQLSSAAGMLDECVHNRIS